MSRGSRRAPRARRLLAPQHVAPPSVGRAYRLPSGLRLKASVELYQFTDFEREVALHLGLAGAL